VENANKIKNAVCTASLVIFNLADVNMSLQAGETSYAAAWISFTSIISV
jgi:hypothetical protein